MRTIEYIFYSDESGEVDYDFEVEDKDVFRVIYMNAYMDVLPHTTGRAYILPIARAREHFEGLPHNLQEIIIDAYWAKIEETYRRDAYLKFLNEFCLKLFKNFEI